MKVGITDWALDNAGKTLAAYLCDSKGIVVDTAYCKKDNPKDIWTHSGKLFSSYLIEWDEE